MIIKSSQTAIMNFDDIFQFNTNSSTTPNGNNNNANNNNVNNNNTNTNTPTILFNEYSNVGITTGLNTRSMLSTTNSSQNTVSINSNNNNNNDYQSSYHNNNYNYNSPNNQYNNHNHANLQLQIPNSNYLINNINNNNNNNNNNENSNDNDNDNAGHDTTIITTTPGNLLQHTTTTMNNNRRTPTTPSFNLSDQLVKQQERFLKLQTRLDQPPSSSSSSTTTTTTISSSSSSTLEEEQIEEECIPPDKTCFPTLEDGKEYLKEYMKMAKIGLVICDSRKNSYTSYRCDRGGSYRDRRNINESVRVRKLRTRKCNCQFKLILKLNKLDDKWHLILKNLKHNHQLTNLENLPILRRRDDTIKQEIKLLLDSGIKNPTQIKNFLMTKFNGIVITKRDIYNEIGEYTRRYSNNDNNNNNNNNNNIKK